MIDVFMTPTQSDDEFSEESISPSDEMIQTNSTSSPDHLVSGFTIGSEEEKQEKDNKALTEQ